MIPTPTPLRLTFLGTGTSQGVPVIGCDCAVCCSIDPRDARLRTSAMVEVGDKRFIIDAGPDFRQQMLRENISHITAILLTHKHKDHIGGLDDVRALNFVDYPDAIHTVHIYGTKDGCECVRKDFDYAFCENPYRGVPQMELHEFGSESFVVEGVEIVPIRGKHSRFEITGFRIGRLAYLTDFKEIAEDESLRKCGTIVEVDQPGRGKFLTIGCPPKFSSYKPEVKPAPALGQHTDEVLREIGYTPEEIAALRSKKVV